MLSSAVAVRLYPKLNPFRLPQRLGSRPCTTPIHPHLTRRTLASVTDLSSYPKPGEQLHGFTLKRLKNVPELDLTALHLEHDETGAQYMHLARDDPNNVFSIGFKTNPPDDTGVPHILEHVTLCGSKKYPVRDPFFKMLLRSQANFMNAFTSSDHTSYPFSTTNPQDFKNLMSVYLDATLNPLLTDSDFDQEGWRIGPEGKEMAFKGVVYNEMKGQMSDSNYLFYIRFQNHIFPDINNSGGDPISIPDLTVQKLRQFHKENYHPSNAKLFTYGNFPLSDHLSQLQDGLQLFGKQHQKVDIKSPINLSNGPKSISIKGPVDDLSDTTKQHKTSVSWITGDTSDLVEVFSLNVLSSLLIGGYGSPIYRKLIESGLGSDFSPNTGYDTSGKTGIFSIGLAGVQVDQVDTVKASIQQCLQDVADKGFDPSKVDGILHQTELAIKNRVAHFGMGIVNRIGPGWFQGVDPFDALAWNQTVNSFKERYAQGDYFENLIKKHLLTDQTFTFTMEPSSSFNEAQVSGEKSRLQQKLAALPKNVSEHQLVEKEKSLAAMQQTAKAQDLSCLPTLRLEDIPIAVESKKVRGSFIGPVSVQWRETPTNGLTYFRAIHTVGDLDENLRKFVPLFNAALFRFGTKNETTEQIEDLIKLKTGGIEVGYHNSAWPEDNSQYNEGISFSGLALDGNVPFMYDLFRNVIIETDFLAPGGNAKIRELVQSMTSGAMGEIAESGHAYAAKSAASTLGGANSNSEVTAGLTQVRLMAELASRPENDEYRDVVTHFREIQRLVISNSAALRVAITCSREAVSTNEAHLQSFLQSIPNPLTLSGTYSRAHPTSGAPPPSVHQSEPQSDSKVHKLQEEHSSKSSAMKTLYPLPYQVHYLARSLPVVPYTSDDSPALQILAQLLTHKHLHYEIREKGGAYGGGMFMRALSGHVTFYSYRDPNPENTLKVFEEAGRWAAEKDWSERDLEEAKLVVFQSIDAPESVSAEGMTRFVSGVTPEMERSRRQALLNVTVGDVKRVAKEYLVKGAQKGQTCVIGERKDWMSTDWQVKDLGTKTEL